MLFLLHTRQPVLPNGYQALVWQLLHNRDQAKHCAVSQSQRGAASHIDITTETGPAKWHFADAVFHQLSHTGRDNLRLVTVRGESMLSDLEDGDTILIDMGQNHPRPSGIFVLDDGHGLVVKRLEFVPHKQKARVRIISSNMNFVPYRRKFSEIRIIGRVIWMARPLR